MGAAVVGAAVGTVVEPPVDENIHVAPAPLGFGKHAPAVPVPLHPLQPVHDLRSAADAAAHAERSDPEVVNDAMVALVPPTQVQVPCALTARRETAAIAARRKQRMSMWWD